MIVGHYAAALVPYSRLRGRAPLWLLLLCAQVPEFVWLALSLAGIETPHPDSMLDATFQNLAVQMTYSHNLVPALGQALVVGLIVVAVWRRRDVAAWCAGLVVAHVSCDYIVGFQHQVLGPSSPAVALDSYGRAPHAAIAFELIFALALVALYHRSEATAGRPISGRRRAALYATFGVGIAAWFPAATLPLRELVG